MLDRTRTKTFTLGRSVEEFFALELIDPVVPRRNVTGVTVMERKFIAYSLKTTSFIVAASFFS